ncbi:hypothetical protein DPMN_127460 [Dreissena polymorpha]|uniref:Uncharacterized protein n=1 Tax=Dreissena polymorpha TaxID=45954 RepID=A0A9D4GZ03_DREPO|nr:hypothetical protein DPMN_127460 [Dreissena polymorpha]
MLDTLTKLQSSTKSEADKCIRLRDELKQLRDATQDISDKSKQELCFIATRKCEKIIKQSKTFLKSTLRDQFYISFQPNSEIVQYLTTLLGLGMIEHSTQIERMMVQNKDPNKVITVQGKSEHNVKISGDSWECDITAILFLPAKQILVANYMNKKVKHLDQQYQVVSHCSVTSYPLALCDITPSEVAVTVNDPAKNIHEVQFITVNNRQLVIGRKLQLQHACVGIAFHQGDMYITAMTALYKYTLNGKLVSKMYEDTSDSDTGKNNC